MNNEVAQSWSVADTDRQYSGGIEAGRYLASREQLAMLIVLTSQHPSFLYASSLSVLP